MNANTSGVGDAGGGGASSGGGGSSGSGDSSSASTAAVLQNLAIEMASITLSYSLLFFGVRYLMREMDPQRQAKQQGDEHKRKLMQKLTENGREGFAMDDYEAIIANDLIYPEDIDVTFEMIGGLDEVKTEIFDIVALPLQRPDLFVGRSKLLSPPKGILLFGPPGTGKTMMAKAIARESGAAFINLQMSTTMNKWFGESQKLIRATFSLAWKLAPCVVFIDEIDSFMRERSSDDPSAQANMKSEFLALWDGMLTQNAPHGGGYGVIVVGATNRPWDIDPAILRRMPRTFKLDLPSMEQRLQILKIYLQDEDLDSSLRGGDMVKLAQLLNGYSGSDIKELCQAAAMLPFREFARECRANGNLQPETKRLRKLTIRDFLNAMKDVRATGQAAYEYHDEAAAKQQGGGPFGGGGGAAAGVSADQFQLMLRAFMEYAVQPRISP
ncbi:26S proteasome regulatory subunit 8-like [Hondaea fermentalgiana]|uniref:26S proteasome regulatory subunit 8-like n=1 Tax=Hondaea fermentalgiana TaxID=2315210 RepID=A0A2R5GJF4_9STRA|nr:26S proteasome regulatory subunit 8-like [Hondaea fermentalgiana]|eukprot:GBG28793.1 26S proteasome regulatory subunit 8-like [Hondaea fermentalgiana]